MGKYFKKDVACQICVSASSDGRDVRCCTTKPLRIFSFRWKRKLRRLSQGRALTIRGSLEVICYFHEIMSLEVLMSRKEINMSRWNGTGMCIAFAASRFTPLSHLWLGERPQNEYKTHCSPIYFTITTYRGDGTSCSWAYVPFCLTV